MCLVQKWLCCFSLFHFALISCCCESSASFHSQNDACSQSSNLAGTLILNSNVPLLAKNISVCLFKGQMQKHLISGLTLSRNRKQCRVSDLELQARVCYFYCGDGEKKNFISSPQMLYFTHSNSAGPQPVWVVAAGSDILQFKKCQLAWLVSKRSFMNTIYHSDS